MAAADMKLFRTLSFTVWS